MTQNTELKVKITGDAKSLQGELEKTSSSLDKMRGGIARIVQLGAGIFAFKGLGDSVRNVVGLAEAAKQIDARLRIATKSAVEFAQAQDKIRQISINTGTALEANAGLYSKLRVNAGLAGAEALKLTDLIAKATKLDGGGAGAQAAVFQLQQGLASGTLRGEELNSVLEQTPSLAKAIADGLGLGIAEMRELAASGGLTASKVKEALFKMSADIEGNYAKLPKTIGGAFENIKTQLISALGKIDQSFGFTDKIAKALQLIADNIKPIVTVVSVGLVLALQAAVVAVARWTVALVASSIVTARATGVTATYVTSLASVSGAATVATVSVGRFALVAAGLSRIMALFGGPIGIAIGLLVTLGVMLYDKFSNAKTPIEQTKEAVVKLAESFQKINDQVNSATSAIRQQFNSAIEGVKASSKGLEDSYKSQTNVILDEMQRRIGSAQDTADQEIAINALKYTSEEGLLQANLQSVIAAEDAKRKAIGEAATQALSAWQVTYENLIAAATAAGTDIAVIEQEATAAKIKLVGEFEAAYRNTINNLINEEQRLLGEAKRIGEERAGFSKTIEDKLRDMRRSTMDDYAAYQDKQKQVDEKQAAARSLIAKGDADSIKAGQKLAEDALRLAESTAGQVTKTVEENGKKVTTVVVTQEEANNKAMGQITESANLVQQAMDKLQQSAKDGAAAAGDNAEKAKAQLEALSGEAAKLQQSFASGIDVKFNADTDKLKAALAEAQKLADANKIAVKLEIKAQELTAALDELAKYPDRLPKLKPVIELNAEQMRSEMQKLGDEVKDKKIELPASVNLDDARLELSKFTQEIKTTLKVETNSAHTIDSNAKEVEENIARLQGKDTTSTHTVITRNVTEKATGGLITPVAKFATGGAVGKFNKMRDGIVPGVGDGDTVPRTLEAGSFVLRKAAVQKYGANRLVGLMQKVQHFANGGSVGGGGSFSAMDNGNGALLARAESLGGLALRNRIIKEWEKRSALFSGTTQGSVRDYGKMLEDTAAALDRLQIEIERKKGIKGADSFQFATGGSVNDTVPAMLTPGEVVVNKSAVQRMGLGFFNALNNLKTPSKVLGFNTGGVVPGAAMPNLGQGQVGKTVNVTLKLPNGQSKTVQTVNDTDGNLLESLRLAGLSAV